MGKNRIIFILRGKNVVLTKEEKEEWFRLLNSEYFGKIDSIRLFFKESDDPNEFDFDKDTLRSFLDKNVTTGMLALESKENTSGPNSSLEITFGKQFFYEDYRALCVTIDQDNFVENNGVLKLIEFIRRSSKLFRLISLGTSNAALDLAVYNNTRGIKPIIATLGAYIRWIHIWGPSVYKEYYKKEDLLNAPAYKIEEWENEVIFMMSYKDPFSIDSPETEQQIIRLSNYLNDKAVIEQW
jgi:hypothetical protein